MKCDFVYEKHDIANESKLPTKGTTSQGGEGALWICWGRWAAPLSPLRGFPSGLSFPSTPLLPQANLWRIMESLFLYVGDDWLELRYCMVKDLQPLKCFDN